MEFPGWGATRGGAYWGGATGAGGAENATGRQSTNEGRDRVPPDWSHLKDGWPGQFGAPFLR